MLACTYALACSEGHSRRRRAWLAKVCPCAECAAWRHPVAVRVPVPHIPQGFLAPRGSPERAEGARVYNRVTLDAMEPRGVVYALPGVDVLL